MSRLILHVALLLILFLIGCSPPPKRKDPGSEELDSLWRAGYGYNNPNPERRKQGLPPVDFDGQVRKH